MRMNVIILYYSMLAAVMSGTLCAVGAGPGAIYDWAVVGGGPGGIITVAVLLDVGISPEKILWIDPEFGVGRMGKYFGTVPANNKAKLLVEFLHMCPVFDAVQTPAVQRLHAADQEKEYPLQFIIDPLQDITTYFLTRVHSVRSSLAALDFYDDMWNLTVGDCQQRARRVVLAIGSHPRHLDWGPYPEIPLECALNRNELAKVVTASDTVAVVGGAHSAVLVLKFLCDLNVARIVNFYKTPLYYRPAEEQAAREIGCTLHGDPLQGLAAQWAREVLDVNPPGNLIRIKTSDAALKAWLPICTKIIYAAGFEQNPLPPISGATVNYDPRTGVIGPHLFGIGLAFPELIDTGTGTCQFSIGLRDFMRTAQKMVPEWMHKEISYKYEKYDNYIMFNQL